METLVTTLVPFGDVILSLRRMRAPKLLDAVDFLTNARAVTASACIMQELAPDAVGDTLADNSGFLFDPDDNPLLAPAIDAISEIAPLDTDAMDVEIQDGSFPLLLPAQAGYPLSWDEWEYWSTQLAAHATDKLYIFWTAIRLGEGEVLERASMEYDWWEWGLEIPDEWPDEIDWERFETELRKRGLGCFIAAREICCYDTGNPYFDWNPYDGEFGDGAPAYDFTIEGARQLEALWQKAKPMLADFQVAKDRFDADPSLAGKLLEIFLGSAPKKKRTRVRTDGRTLVEIFRQQEAREAVNEVLRDTGLFEEGLYDHDDDDPAN